MMFFIYGDNVDTDVIIPARHLNDSSEENLKAHCMEDIDGDFAKTVRAGDAIAAGYNFGCGSSREHAPLAIKYSGIRFVVAKSFARIFYRNALNIGLTLIECPEAVDAITAGENLKLDEKNWCFVNEDNKKTYKFQPFSDFQQKLIAAGGLLKLSV